MNIASYTAVNLRTSEQSSFGSNTSSSMCDDVNHPSVTIGLPAYNEGIHLAETLVTLLGQTYTDFELLLANNGSTDQTLSVMKEFAAEDSRVKILNSKNNEGAIWNFRRLLDAAHGDFFAWVGGHDLYDSEWLETLVGVLSTDDQLVLVSPQVRRILPDNRMFSVSSNVFDSRGLTDVARVEKICRMPNAGERVYGLYRTKIAQKCPVHSIARWDTLFLSELSLAGDMMCVEEPLWYRRFDAEPKGDREATILAIKRQNKILYPPGKKLSILRRLPSLFHLFSILIDGWRLTRANGLAKLTLPIKVARWHQRKSTLRIELQMLFERNTDKRSESG